jgi:hypothetical protein
VFDRGATKATITDFEPGIDKIVFEHAGRLEWHDVKLKSLYGNTIMFVGDDQIELIDVRPHEVSKHDFVFDI